MKCFNHNNNDAIGICKHCQKGICVDCITLVKGSVSCQGACEQEVAAYNYMMEQGKKVYKNLGKQWGPSVVINGIGGTLFLGFGLYNIEQPSSSLLIGIGTIMLIAGVMSFAQGKRMGESKASSGKL